MACGDGKVLGLIFKVSGSNPLQRGFPIVLGFLLDGVVAIELVKPVLKRLTRLIEVVSHVLK